MLFSADLGARTVGEIVEGLEKEISAKEITLDGLKSYLKTFLKTKMDTVQSELDDKIFNFKSGSPTQVFMIVGINGAGKTTTIGKLQQS